MGKKARTRRARNRIDERLWEGRGKKHDLLLWQFPYWNKERLQQLDRWEKSRETLYSTPEEEGHWNFLYKQIIHNGRKP